MNTTLMDLYSKLRFVSSLESCFQPIRRCLVQSSISLGNSFRTIIEKKRAISIIVCKEVGHRTVDIILEKQASKPTSRPSSTHSIPFVIVSHPLFGPGVVLIWFH